MEGNKIYCAEIDGEALPGTYASLEEAMSQVRARFERDGGKEARFFKVEPLGVVMFNKEKES